MEARVRFEFTGLDNIKVGLNVSDGLAELANRYLDVGEKELQVWGREIAVSAAIEQ